MTLKEMKQRTLALIEEINKDSKYLTDDIDIQEKINYVIDMKQHELARIKKIAVSDIIKAKEGQQVNLYEEYPDFYKLEKITGVKYDIFDSIVDFEEEGEAKVYYYKYPTKIDAQTTDDYEFELSTDVLEIMPYGVAADLLKSDVSAQYGQVYERAYRDALNMLDISANGGIFEIKGGLNV